MSYIIPIFSLLAVSETCREEVTKLVCSFNDLTRSYQSECPGPESVQECAKCRKANAKKYSTSAWIQICILLDCKYLINKYMFRARFDWENARWYKRRKLSLAWRL